MKGREKFVLTVPMILGLDGKTMSKTSRNTVNITDLPEEMYGKLMTLQDSLVSQYFALCTDIPAKEVEILKKKLSLRNLKARLAQEITSLYHGAKKAEQAEKEFVRVFKEKQLPSNIKKIEFVSSFHEMPLYQIIRTLFSISGLEARRVIEQGGVKIDGVVQKNPSMISKLRRGTIIQVGKRRTLQVI